MPDFAQPAFAQPTFVKPGPLTAEQAKSIRDADSVCFDHTPAEDAATTGNAHGVIRAITEGHRHGATGQITVSIPIEVSRVQDFGRSEGPYTGFDMIGTATYDRNWRTVCRQIKAGSRIGLVWTRNNSSPLTEQAGIVVDMLDIEVQNGNVCSTYRLRTQVGLDNSARMVRVAK